MTHCFKGGSMKKDISFHIFKHIVLIVLSLACVMPFLLMIIASFTENSEIAVRGYSFFPENVTFFAYQYIFERASMIFRAYGITILITIVGTACGLLISMLLAYPISRKDMPFRNVFTFFVFFTMLFNGGLVPTYLIYTQWFGIKNEIFALIIPNLLMSSVNVLLLRTYFANNIPEAVIESASMDGAGELMIFMRIVIPLSKPIVATVGLLIGIAYWNDWYNGMVYITDESLFSLQNYLARVSQDIQFMIKSSNANYGEIANLPSETVRMAIAVLGSMPIILAFPLFQKYFIKGIALGAVKG